MSDQSEEKWSSLRDDLAKAANTSPLKVYGDVTRLSDEHLNKLYVELTNELGFKTYTTCWHPETGNDGRTWIAVQQNQEAELVFNSAGMKISTVLLTNIPAVKKLDEVISKTKSPQEHIDICVTGIGDCRMARLERRYQSLGFATRQEYSYGTRRFCITRRTNFPADCKPGGGWKFSD